MNTINIEAMDREALPLTRKKLPNADQSRQRWCRQKALWMLSAFVGPGKSFEVAFARIRRRWRVSTAGADFEARARREWATQIEKDRIEQERFEAEQQRRAATFLPAPPSPQSALGRVMAARRLAAAPIDRDKVTDAHFTVAGGETNEN